jgi:hypothetical protein
MITDRDPAEKDRRVAGRFTSNGSVASHSSQVSQASRPSPPTLISNRKYVLDNFELPPTLDRDRT